MRTNRKVEPRLLTPTEKRSIQTEIRELEQGIGSPVLIGFNGGRGGVWTPSQDFSTTHSDARTNPGRLALLKRRLEAGSTEDLSRKTINTREKRIKELEDKVAARLAPRSNYYQKRGDTGDYDKTVQHIANVEMGKEQMKDVSELKNLYRARSANESRLANSIENPANASIEHLRK